MEFTLTNDMQGLNQALFLVTHGLYILTSSQGGKLNGQCLDSLMQVTNMPPRIAIGVSKRSLTHEMIKATGKFAVNVIDKDDPGWRDKVKCFGFQSGRNVEKFADVKYEVGQNGSPLLPDAVAFYECAVMKEHSQDLGTHTIFVAAVERAGTRGQGEPLTYNEYRKLTKKK